VAHQESPFPGAPGPRPAEPTEHREDHRRYGHGLSYGTKPVRRKAAPLLRRAGPLALGQFEQEIGDASTLLSVVSESNHRAGFRRASAGAEGLENGRARRSGEAADDG